MQQHNIFRFYLFLKIKFSLRSQYEWRIGSGDGCFLIFVCSLSMALSISFHALSALRLIEIRHRNKVIRSTQNDDPTVGLFQAYIFVRTSSESMYVARRRRVEEK